jgi:hypothetical protein
MVKPLSDHEEWLFAWTKSVATTVPAQREAIKRCGLKGLKKKQVLAMRDRKFREWCATKDDLPEWYLAAWYEEVHGAKEMFSHAPVEAGAVARCFPLAGLAYQRGRWGRLRRRDYGRACARPAWMCEHDNGKSGWDKVIEHRGINYTCVLSPDKTKVIVQTVVNGPMTLHSVRNNHFLYEGRRLSLDTGEPSPPTPRYLRAYVRLYRMNGLDARLVRQTESDAANGSGEDTGGWMKVIVVADGCGGFYHTSRRESVKSIREALAKRRRRLRAAELDQVILSQGDTLFVGLADSLAAGNCSPGTEAFIVEFSKRQGAVGPIGAATAKAILSCRDDLYTRRACQVAAMRYLR